MIYFCLSSSGWKKDKKADGYTLQYSTSKNFKNAKMVNIAKKKTSVTIKKLKAGKKYYIRVRAYKKAKENGKNKTLYGAYSAKKTVKVE